MESMVKPIKERKAIRSELNIEKWPIFTTSNFKGESRELNREIITKDGKVLSKKVIIGKIADKEVGVLRTFEMKGFYALVKIWEESGKPINQNVSFSLHQIAEILRRDWGRTTHKQIRNMIDRLRFTPIKWVYSWKQRDDDKEYSLEDGFTILADKQIFEKRESNQKVFAFSSFKFHEAILKNLSGNHTKPVYLDIVLRFKKEISILLYRQLDLIMADKNFYERRTRELFNDLELGEYKYPSKRKQLLDPVLKELEGIELTTGFLSYAKLEQTTDGKDWKVVFRKSRKSLQLEHKEEEKEASKEEVSLIEFFNQKFPHYQGTLKEVLAEDLIKKHSFDKIMLHIARINSDGSIKNPVGLLRVSLEQDWDLPPTKEEVQRYQRQEKAEQERKQQEEQQREREKYFKEKEEEERLDKIFLSIPKEEQESLKEEAKRLIIEERLDDSQNKVSEMFLRDIMVMIKVRELLKEREEIDTGIQG